MHLGGYGGEIFSIEDVGDRLAAIHRDAEDSLSLRRAKINFLCQKKTSNLNVNDKSTLEELNRAVLIADENVISEVYGLRYNII